MNSTSSTRRKLLTNILAILCGIAFTGCDYEVPITAEPTRKIEEKLLGDWKPVDEGDKPIKIRKLDESNYIFVLDQEPALAFHSDVANTPFLSVEGLSSKLDSKERAYVYVTWSVSKDGNKLSFYPVNYEVVSNKVKDSATIQKLLKENLKNPKLLGDEVKFIRESR